MKLLIAHLNRVRGLASAFMLCGAAAVVCAPSSASAAQEPALESFASASERYSGIADDILLDVPWRLVDGNSAYSSAYTEALEQASQAQERGDFDTFSRSGWTPVANRFDENFDRGLLGHLARGGGWFQEREFDYNDIRLNPSACVPEIGRNLMMLIGFLAVVFMVRRQSFGGARRRHLSVAA